MKKLALALVFLASLTQTANAAEQEIRGMIQIENPCILGALTNGCVRVLTNEGPIFYIQLDDHEPGTEFNIVKTRFENITLFRLWFNGTDSVLLSQNQPVLLSVEKNASTIKKIYSVTTTGHLTNK